MTSNGNWIKNLGVQGIHRENNEEIIETQRRKKNDTINAFRKFIKAVRFQQGLVLFQERTKPSTAESGSAVWWLLHPCHSESCVTSSWKLHDFIVYILKIHYYTQPNLLGVKFHPSFCLVCTTELSYRFQSKLT